MESMPFFVVPLVIAIIALAVFGIIQGAKQRKRAIAQKRRLARRMGCEFHEKDPFRLAARFERTFPSLKSGSNRYAFNVITGEWEGIPIWIFDHHNETTSTDSKGNRTTHHHYAGYIVLRHNFESAQLEVRREHLFDGLGALFGFDDIDFESEAFSKRWMVKANDRKFAYALFDPQMIDYFLTFDRFAMSLREEWGLYRVEGGMSALDIRKTLRRIEGFLERIPRFVRKDYAR